jgi:DNA-binding HxlR family transcriptional regulator
MTLKADAPRSNCPISRFLDLFGDRWTLLILRDLLCGKSRFAEFEASPERIPASILADRMRRLLAEGLVTREAYQDRPTRHAYRLTDRGRSLHPVLVTLGEWSEIHVPDTWRLPDGFRHP